jgi:hypothetical protein
MVIDFYANYGESAGAPSRVELACACEDGLAVDNTAAQLFRAAMRLGLLPS